MRNKCLCPTCRLDVTKEDPIEIKEKLEKYIKIIKDIEGLLKPKENDLEELCRLYELKLFSRRIKIDHIIKKFLPKEIGKSKQIGRAHV